MTKQPTILASLKAVALASGFGLGAFAALAAFAPAAQAKISQLVVVEPGVLVRGAQPQNAADYAKLKKMGIKTIINLMAEPVWQNEQATAAADGFAFVHIAMNDWVAPTPDNISQIKFTLEEIDKARHGQPSSITLPVFVHCHQGYDRTGLFVFLYHVLVARWSNAKAYYDMFLGRAGRHALLGCFARQLPGFLKRRYVFVGKLNPIIDYLDRDYPAPREALHQSVSLWLHLLFPPTFVWDCLFPPKPPKAQASGSSLQ